MEGTNKAHENSEAMDFVGVRLTAQLGAVAKYMQSLIIWLIAEPFASIDLQLVSCYIDFLWRSGV